MSFEKRRATDNIFSFQTRAMPILAGWGLFSILTGWSWRQRQDRWLRSLGIQFLSWGTVNMLIALSGIRGARQKAIQFLQGTLPDQEHERQARLFEKVVAINAGLDVGYMAAGAWLNRHQDEARRGMGVGIFVQGLFLFIWDLVLWRLARKYPQENGRP